MAYQKEGVLKDGTRVKLRPLVKEDREMLLKFFQGLGEKELTIEEIRHHARRNTDVILKIVMRYIERRRG